MGTTTAYEAIIVGASFAGLAVANQLRGHRVLLLDRKPVGAGQTSACGTILRVLQHYDLSAAVLQVHDHLALHTRWNDILFPSPYPWCTFDYYRLCRLLFERSGAEFLQAPVQSIRDGRVCTDKGDFEAACVVDASGWHSVASHMVPGTANARTVMSFGIETDCPASGKAAESAVTDGLHFWYDSTVLPHGVGWIFPRGSEIALGLASYRGAQPLRDPLAGLGQKYDLQPTSYHGTYFPHRLRAPVMGTVFRVGDSAGMCLGLTGEGIRPALYFGEQCGLILGEVLERRLTLQQGLERYAALVRGRKLGFDILSIAQEVLTRVPPTWIDRIAHGIVREGARSWFFQHYWELAPF